MVRSYRMKFIMSLRERSLTDYNRIVQADTVNGFVTAYTLGLFGFYGCGYAAVGEGDGWIHAD